MTSVALADTALAWSSRIAIDPGSLWERVPALVLLMPAEEAHQRVPAHNSSETAGMTGS